MLGSAANKNAALKGVLLNAVLQNKLGRMRISETSA
jgi:hypothetical protein